MRNRAQIDASVRKLLSAVNELNFKQHNRAAFAFNRMESGKDSQDSRRIERTLKVIEALFKFPSILWESCSFCPLSLTLRTGWLDGWRGRGHLGVDDRFIGGNGR